MPLLVPTAPSHGSTSLPPVNRRAGRKATTSMASVQFDASLPSRVIKITATFGASCLLSAFLYWRFNLLANHFLLLLGIGLILKFLRSEYLLVRKKLELINSKGPNREYALVESTGKSVFGGKTARIRRRSPSISWNEILEYRIDHYFSSSSGAKPILLLSATFLLITIGSACLSIIDPDDYPDSSAALWTAWTYVADPGTHASAPPYLIVRLASAAISIGGMLIFALMIGIISDGIGERVDEWKRGSSRVVEWDHTLMLGWNDKSLAIIQQIALANQSEGGGMIVVLADREKEEMELLLKKATENQEDCLNLFGTEVIFRSGNPLMEYDLRRVSLETARSVIALSADMSPDEADSRMVRQVLAIKAYPNFVSESGSCCHVVVELQDVDNRELINLVTPIFVEIVVAHDIVGRFMIQCSRQPGLAHVLEAMVGFEGSEFYFEEWPEVIGETFESLTCRFDDAIPVGVKTTDGEVKINPENSYRIKCGDRLLVLAEDNDSYCVNDGTYFPTVSTSVILSKTQIPRQEKLLFCGWRRDMADMIMQLDAYVSKGSELWLLNLVPVQQRSELLKDKGNKEELQLVNLTIRNAVGNPIIRRDLNEIIALDIEGVPTGDIITLDQFDSILILADGVAIENGANMESCDSRSLACLLIIQEIQQRLFSERVSAQKRGSRKYIRPSLYSLNPFCNPVSEILDTRTRSLLTVAGCKGYIMSNHIISAVIAQVSEEKDINVVFQELLSAEGCETYLKKVSDYVDIGNGERALSFWDIALRARKRREVAIGFKPEDLTYTEANCYLLNPPDKAKVRLWKEGDILIVIAFD